MFKSLNSKFATLLILFIVFSLGIPTGFLIWQFRQNFMQRSEVLVSATFDVIDNCLSHSMLNPNKNIQFLLEEHTNDHNVDHIRIYDEDGTIKYSSDKNEVGTKIADFDEQSFAVTSDTSRLINAYFNKNTYLIHEPIQNSKQCQKCHSEIGNIAYLNLESHFTSAERRFYTGSFHLLYLSIVLIIILFSGLYLFFRNFVNNPLNKIIHGIDKIEKGNLDTQIDVRGGVEFSSVAQHFNQMTKRLKESQDELERLHFEQLQRADRLVTLGELAAEMAHEINNPAGVVLTRADYMELEAGDNPLLHPYKEDIEVIISQMQKISAITGNVLKYSKKLPTEKQPINLGELVTNSVRILEPRLQKKQIEIILDYTCESTCENARILANPQQIEQVLINLVNNSIDSIEEQGTIKIFVKCLTDGAKQLTVTDSGRGMTTEERDQIFTPFFTTKSAEKGTGLGLYIVKKICDEHNAEITCYSEPNKGTSFIITFLGEREEL